MTHQSACTSSHIFHRGACSSVVTMSEFCQERGKLEKNGEKETKVSEGVVAGACRGGGCGQCCRARVWSLFVHSPRESQRRRGDGAGPRSSRGSEPNRVNQTIEAVDTQRCRQSWRAKHRNRSRTIKSNRTCLRIEAVSEARDSWPARIQHSAPPRTAHAPSCCSSPRPRRVRT